MTTNPQVLNPYQQFFGLDGLPLTGGYVYIGLANQDPETNPTPVFWDEALTIPAAQPLRTIGGYLARSGAPAKAYLATSPYSIRVRNKVNVEVYYLPEAHDEFADTLGQIADGDGSLLGYQPRGWTTPATVKKYLDNSVQAHLIDGLTTDQTAAINAAVTALGSNGGVIDIPVGTFCVNAVIAQDNIVLRGQGGRGEYNATCLNPYDLSKPTLTFGNDVGPFLYCGIENMHVSGAALGTDGTHYAQQAPQALLLKGGTYKFHASNFVLYGGKQTLALVPASPTSGPITKCVFSNGEIRNDVTDSANARGIYMIRKGSNAAYLTALRFFGVDLNMAPGNLGYAAELDGTLSGFVPQFFGCYWDIRPALGVLLKGSANISAWDLTLDPGATGVVVIEADQAVADLSRFLEGLIRIDQQLFKFTGGVTETVPVFANFFGYRGRYYSPFLGDFGFLTSPTDPYNTSVGWDSSGSEVAWTGKGHYFQVSARAPSYRDVNGNQVVTTRQPAVTTPTLSSPSANETALLNYITALRDAARTHGLIA
jgi:hypothetical protein